MSDQSKRLIRSLGQSLSLLIELIVAEDNPAMQSAPEISVEPKILTTSAAIAPRKKAVKKATKKRAKKAAAPTTDDEDDDLDDDEEDESQQRTTPAISLTEAVEKAGRFIAKKGLYQTFTGDDIRKIFDGGLSAETLKYVTERWMARGVIERTVKGDRSKPATYKKVAQIQGED